MPSSRTTNLPDYRTKPVLPFVIFLAAFSLAAFSPASAAFGNRSSTALQVSERHVQSLSRLGDRIAQINRDAAWRVAHIRSWVDSGRVSEPGADPELDEIALSTDELLLRLVNAARTGSGDPVTAFVNDEHENRNRWRSSSSETSSAVVAQSSAAAQLFFRYVERPGRTERLRSQLPVATTSASAALLGPPLREAIAETLIQQTGDAARLSAARAYASADKDLMNWINATRAWHDLEDAVQAFDSEQLDIQLPWLTDGRTGRDEKNARSREKLSQLHTRRTELRDEVERTYEALQASLRRSSVAPTVNNIRSMQHLFEAAELANRLFGVTNAGAACTLKEEHRLLRHEMQGIGEPEWDHRSAVASSPKPPVELTWADGKAFATRHGYARHVVLVATGTSYAQRTAWHELDLGVRAPESLWGLSDSDDDISILDVGAVYVSLETLAETLHERGLPPYIGIASASADLSSKGLTLCLTPQLPGPGLAAPVSEQLVLTDADLGDLSRLSGTLQRWARRTLGRAFDEIDLPVPAGTLLYGVPQEFKSSVAQGVWLTPDGPPTIELWTETTEGWPIRLYFGASGPSFQLATLDGDSDLVSEIVTGRISGVTEKVDALSDEIRARRVFALQLSTHLAPEIARALEPGTRAARSVPFHAWELKPLLASATLDMLRSASIHAALDAEHTELLWQLLTERCSDAVASRMKERWTDAAADRIANRLSSAVLAYFDRHGPEPTSAPLAELQRTLVQIRGQGAGLLAPLEDRWLTKEAKSAATQAKDLAAAETLTRLLSASASSGLATEQELAEGMFQQWLSRAAESAGAEGPASWHVAGDQGSWEDRKERSAESIASGVAFTAFINATTDTEDHFDRAVSDAVDQILASSDALGVLGRALLTGAVRTETEAAARQFVESYLRSPPVLWSLTSPSTEARQSANLHWRRDAESTLAARLRGLLHRPPGENQPETAADTIAKWASETTASTISEARATGSRSELPSFEPLVSASNSDENPIPEAGDVFDALRAQLVLEDGASRIRLKGSIASPYAPSQPVEVDLPLQLVASQSATQRASALRETRRRSLEQHAASSESLATEETAETNTAPPLHMPFPQEPIDQAAWLWMVQHDKADIREIEQVLQQRAETVFKQQATHFREKLELELLGESITEESEVNAIGHAIDLIAASESTLAVIQTAERLIEELEGTLSSRDAANARNEAEIALMSVSSQLTDMGSFSTEQLQQLEAATRLLADQQTDVAVVMETAKNALHDTSAPLTGAVTSLESARGAEAVTASLASLRENFPAKARSAWPLDGASLPDSVTNAADLLVLPRHLAERELRRIELLGDRWIEDHVMPHVRAFEDARVQINELSRAAEREEAWTDPGSDARRTLNEAAQALQHAVQQYNIDPTLLPLDLIPDLQETVDTPLGIKERVRDHLATTLTIETDAESIRAAHKSLITESRVAFGPEQALERWNALREKAEALRDEIPEYLTKHLDGTEIPSELTELQRAADALVTVLETLGASFEDMASATAQAKTRLRGALSESLQGLESQHDDSKKYLKDIKRDANQLLGKIKDAGSWSRLVPDDAPGPVPELDVIKTSVAALFDAATGVPAALMPIRSYLDSERWSEIESTIDDIVRFEREKASTPTASSVAQADDGGPLEAGIAAPPVELQNRSLNAINELENLVKLLDGVATWANAAECELDDVSDTFNSILTGDPDEIGSGLREMNSKLQGVAARFGFEIDTVAPGLEALAGFSDTASYLADDSRGFVAAASELPEAIAADLTSDLFNPSIDLEWDPTQGQFDIQVASMFGNFSETRVGAALADPRLRDSEVGQAIGDWVNAQFPEGFESEIEKSLRQLESETLGQAKAVATAFYNRAATSIESFRQQLPDELYFFGLRLDVEYGRTPGSRWAVRVSHTPEPGSTIPSFQAEGLVVVDLLFSADIENGFEFDFKLNPTGTVKFGSLRPALEQLFIDDLPPGLSLSGDPELNEGTLVIPFRFQPTGMPVPLVGRIEISDPQTVSVRTDVDALWQEIREIIYNQLYEALEGAITNLIESGDTPGIGPVELDPDRPIARLDRTTGEQGLVVGLRLVIADVTEIPVSLTIGFETGFKVDVDPSAIAGTVGPLLESVLGRESLFRVKLGSPPFSTEDQLTIHLDYELDIPVLGAGLGGELSLSRDGVDLGPGVTLTFPGWVEAPPVSVGRFTATLRPKQKSISLSADVTISPGPAMVSALNCRLTGSITYQRPIVITGSGVVSMVRFVELGRSDLRIEPSSGSFEATIASSPVLGSIFRLDGFVQIEADSGNSRHVRGNQYNVSFQSETEVFGLARQTVEGGFNWDAAGLLAIDAGLPLAAIDGVLEFGPDFSSPHLRFRASVADTGDLANIEVLVVVSERLVQVVARAQIGGVPIGIDFVLPGLGDLTPARVIDELLSAFELSLNLDIGFGNSNAPDQGPEGSEGAAGEVKQDGEQASVTPPPGEPERPKSVSVEGKITWHPLAERRWEVVGWKKKKKWVVFSDSDYIRDWRYYPLNGGDRLGLGSAAQLYEAGYRLAYDSSGQFILVVNHNGALFVYDRQSRQRLWRGTTSKNPVTSSTVLSIRPVTMIGQTAIVFSDYGQAGQEAKAIVARQNALIPADAASMEFPRGQCADLTSILIAGERFPEAVTVEKTRSDEQLRLVRLAASLALDSMQFDSFEGLGNDTTLIRRDDTTWIHAAVAGGASLAEFVGAPEEAGNLTDFASQIGRAILTLADEPAISTPNPTGTLPVVCSLGFTGASTDNPSTPVRPIAIGRGQPTPEGGTRYTARLVTSPDEEPADVSLLLANETSSALKISRVLDGARTDDPVLQVFRTFIGQAEIDPTRPIALAMRSDTSTETDIPERPVRRLAASYFTDGSRQFLLIDRGLTEADEKPLPLQVAMGVVREYWERRRSAAPASFSENLSTQFAGYVELLARDDWYQAKQWKADPSGAMYQTTSNNGGTRP